jgi:asparagine synthase (glutamine-hydrolysing)
MCGITGVWYRDSQSDVQKALNLMNSTILHRGPDAGGIWESQTTPGLGFGHRRLSILDLSPEGAQPKKSQSGRYVITFNGEIYNFLELRADLEAKGVQFKGRSDTEVILAGFETWGIKETLTRSVGMFAMGIWDHDSRVLTLARDRIGEKPLYYANAETGFIFASELRAFKDCPEFRWNISTESIGWYFKYGYIPAPLSIYKEAKKLLPGTFLEVKNAGRDVSDPITYWTAKEVFKRGQEDPFIGSFEDAVSQLDGLLSKVIRNQMLSDVPLGAFLSGGVDSSTVTAIMQKVSNTPIKTFSIGFEDKTYNEAHHAALVAKHLSTNHTELYVSGQDALDLVPKLAAIFDEPFSDSSQIPTFLVSKLAKSQVTVALSGDGGDEAFAGYTRYQVSAQLSKHLGHLPLSVSRRLGSILTRHTALLAKASGQRESKWAKLGATLQASGWTDTYEQMITIWGPRDLETSAAHSNLQVLRGLDNVIATLSQVDPVGAAQLLDLHTYLPDDIMVKVDRSAMAVSLESRAPFLDHRIIEFGATLPPTFKSSGREGKKVLKHLLYRYVPKELVNRPKMGFGVPIDEWLQGPLKSWVSDLLSSPASKDALGSHWSRINQEWESYSKTAKGNKYGLWSAAILCDWIMNLRNTDLDRPHLVGPF